MSLISDQVSVHPVVSITGEVPPDVYQRLKKLGYGALQLNELGLKDESIEST